MATECRDARVITESTPISPGPATFEPAVLDPMVDMLAGPEPGRSVRETAITLWSEDDWQLGQAAQDQPVAVAPAQRRPGDGQAHGGEASVQGGERYHALEPGQPGAQAVV